MAEPLRVLMVEDSEDDATLMLHHLRRGGFDPDLQRVDTPEAMQASLEASTPDVILADYSLLKFNAPQALSVLKKTGLDVPLLIVSGSIGEDIAVSCMQAGASDYIMKDKLSRLVPAIRRELRESDGRRARRQAEQALRESEARYRLLVENTTDIITMEKLDGTVLYESSSVERVLGYKPEELVGRNRFELLHPDDVPAATEVIRRLQETGEEFASTEFRIRHRNGSWRTMEVAATLQGSFRGEPVILSTGRDVTERRALEEQFRHAQKMEAVGRLAGGVAHDFNNLLTAILGYSELLLEQLKDQPTVRLDVEEIRKASERAAGLTGQLLAFSRRQVLAPRVLDLNETVAGMGEMIRRLIGEDVELSVTLAPDLGNTRADPGQIEQVILNLVVNARDAMLNGGQLMIETSNTELDENYARRHTGSIPGPYVMLAVSDTGTGMDAETMSHLFEPFFTTKEVTKGTGLGLSTVYGIVKQSGGTIWVYSEPAHGSTFKVYLPRVEESIERRAVSAAPAESPRGTETVLLVEDEETVRALVRDVLGRRGYQVLEARDGQEALALGELLAPVELMITDVVMPGISGSDLAATLTTRFPNLKVLFISGYTDRGIVHQGQLDPRTPFLQKPFTPEALLRKVREVLNEQPATDNATP
ncbi:MAG TPA: response regulator [Candidatus Limnocylindria bacterium]|nr:response regulator [Candidatus Limnocylindria bacterium]